MKVIATLRNQNSWYQTTFLLLSLLALSSCNRFNSDKWKVDKASRQRQVNSIIRSEILIGKSYDNVRSLLGDEDLSTKKHGDSPANLNFTIQYIVGGCNMIDFETLVIIFESNKVIKVEKGCDYPT